MNTMEALQRFLKKCEERGLSPSTRRYYHSYLRHFADEHPELPTTTAPIEDYLRRRGETPLKRGDVFKKIQAFYSYLEEFEGLKSPVPPRGKVGRPPKPSTKLVTTSLEAMRQHYRDDGKLVKGGGSASTSISISTTECVEKFIASRRLLPCADATILDYMATLRLFWNAFPVVPLHPDPIRKWLLSLQVEPISRHHRYVHLKVFYNWLGEELHLYNPMERVEVKKPKDKIRRTLSLEQLQELIALPKSPQDDVMVELFIATEIRAGELCSLQRKDIFPDHILVWGKSGERQVPIPGRLYGKLTSLAASGYLFRGRTGVLRPNGVWQRIHKMLLQLGISGVKMGPHTLRHSGAVQYLMHGGDVESLRQLLGHAKLSTTQIYAQMSAEEVKKRYAEVDLMGKLVPAASPPPPEEKPEKKPLARVPGQLSFLEVNS